MLRLIAATLTVVGLCFSCETASAQIAMRGTGLPSARVLDTYGLKLAWWSQAVINPGLDRVRYVTLDEEIVVVQSEIGSVTAFDNNTGHKLWSAQYGRPNSPSFPVAMNSELVVVPVGTHLYGVSKFNGRLRWSIRMEGDPSTSPSMDETRMYAGAVDGTVYAYDLKKTLRYFQEGQDEKWSFLSVDWRYKAGKEILAPPVTDGASIAFASRDGLIYSLAAFDHRLRFQVETDDIVSAPLGLSDKMLYIVTEAYKAYCVSSERGGIIWEFIIGSRSHKAPIIIGDQVFLLGDTGNMFAVDKHTGVQYWLRERVDQFAAAANSFIYASDEAGDVVMLSRADGSEIGTLPLRHFPIRPENDRTDRLIAVSNTGRVICIHERGREYPLYHKFPDRRPILPEITPEAEAGAANIEGAAENGEPEAGAPER